MGMDVILKSLCICVFQVLFLAAAKSLKKLPKLNYRPVYSKLILLNLYNKNGYILQYYRQKSKILKPGKRLRLISLFGAIEIDFLPGISSGN